MPTYFDFTVSLQDVLPRPWRRFLIASSARFAELHNAIQDACGWTNSHLYLFRAARDYDDAPIAGLRLEDGNDDMPEPLPDATTTRLTRYFGPGEFTTCLYVYDFGDNWTHDVQLNAVVSLPGRAGRHLLGGEHAFPPDDAGGPHGYAAIQRALATGKDSEGRLAWAHGVWGWTGAFDLEETRRRFDSRPRSSGRARRST